MKEYVLITGGSSGLGLELVREALARGFDVCNMSRDPRKIEAMRAAFPERFTAFAGDLTDPDHVAASVKALSEQGRIRMLINCAERGVFRSPAEYTPEDLEVSLQGLRGMALTTAAVLRCTGERDLTVVNVLSSAARKGKPKEALYCAAKWGERGYTEALKAAYAGTSVRIIATYPSGMNTPFWDTSRDYVSAEKAETFLDPADVARQILGNALLPDGEYTDEQIILRT